jgi:helix-turn-helix protein
MTSDDEEPFLTEPEAAEVIRVSARTLRRWRAKGTGPPVAGYAGRRAPVPAQRAAGLADPGAAVVGRSALVAWPCNPSPIHSAVDCLNGR